MISSMLVVLALRVAGMVLWLALTVLLARLLVVEDMALSLLAINIVLLLGALATLGADVSLLRHCSKPWRDGLIPRFRAEYRQGRSLALVGSLTAGGLMVGAVSLELFDTRGMSVEVLLMMSVCIVLTTQMAIHRTVLRTADRVGEAVMAETFIRSFVTLLLSASLAVLGELTFQAFLSTYTIALAIGFGSQLFFLKRLDILQGPTETIPPRTRFALSVWPGDAALVLFQRLPGVLVGFSVDLATAAVFLAAERVAQAGVFLVDAVRTVIGPSIAAAEKDERQNTISTASAIMFVVGLFGGFSTLCLGFLFVYLLGDEYRDALPIVAILLLGQLSYAFLGPTAIIMNMYGEEKLRSLITAVAMCCLAAVLALSSTVFAFAWTYAVMLWAMNLTLAFVIWRKLGHLTGLFGVRKSILYAALSEIRQTALAKFGKVEENDSTAL